MINRIADKEEANKSCPTCLDHNATCPKKKVLSHTIPGRLWECVGTDIITISSKHYLCIVHYYSKFPVVKQVERLEQGSGEVKDNLIRTYKTIFSEFGLPGKIISDVGTNFGSEKFKNFCKKLSIWHGVSSS